MAQHTIQYTPDEAISLDPNQITVLRARAYDSANIYTPSVATVSYFGPPLNPPGAVTLTPLITGAGTADATVTLTPTPGVAGAGDCYVVTETVPYGLTPPSGITPADGYWDPVAGVIRWGPYLNSLPQSFSFIASGASGAYALTTIVSFNGYSKTTTTSLPIDTPADTTPPVLTITYPLEDGGSVSSARLDVTGTASDSGEGDDGVAFVTVNGILAAGDTASGSGVADWSASVQLHTGTNIIVVAAADTLDNTVEQDITVIFLQPVLANPSINGGSGGVPHSIQTTLSGISSGDTIYVQASTDLIHWNLWTPAGFQNPIFVTGSTTSLPITIPIPANPSQELYFRVEIAMP